MEKQNKNDLIKVDMDAEIASSITLPATLAENIYGGSKWSLYNIN
jgi:hypothetical protein